MSTMQTAIEYVQAKGWEFKKQSGEVIVRACPFCGDQKHHFYVHPEDGRYFCHKCQEKGNLWTLKKHMGDIQEAIRPAFKRPKHKRPDQSQAEKYHGALLEDTEALGYLKGRGIKLESIERFKVGLDQYNGTKWLTIPHFQGKDLVNIKFRSLPPTEKTFKRVSGCQSVLFNVDALNSCKRVYLTEGELDAIMCGN